MVNIMIKLYNGGAYLVNGTTLIEENNLQEVNNLSQSDVNKETAKKGTMSYSILEKHNTSGNMDKLKIKFDSMTSHDLTFVGIIQTAKASGMSEFPLPYVLTNCHNSLCAVGGTINSDDHMFGLSAAKKYGGIFVPPHVAVIHQYMREMMAGCGDMILGSDSHTRYGALGTMAIGEGGGELVKQLLSDTYDIDYPDVIAIYLDGKVKPGIGPQDISLAIIGAVFKNGYVKNKVMEFVGPGVSSMSTDFRNGVDVMTTETTCLTSIWRTDEDTKEFLTAHGRGDRYTELNPQGVAYYDGVVYVDLDKIKPMIALPFHPSNVYTIEEVNNNPYDILSKVEKDAIEISGNPNINFKLTDKIVNGKLKATQGIIAGCAGGNYNNVIEAASILNGKSCGNDEFSMSIYPSSQPVYIDLMKKGVVAQLMQSGVIMKTAFCGPCFGAGDTPAHNGLSLRHTTRNFPNREGSKPTANQMSAVALMDARSIAATAANGGILTAATDVVDVVNIPQYFFDKSAYDSRVFEAFEKGEKDAELTYGPNIKDWPEMTNLTENILLKVASKIMDPVTTTDELIPSGETASYRSNPLGLAEFTLSRRDPEYVGRAKLVNEMEKSRDKTDVKYTNEELTQVFSKINTIAGSEAVTQNEVEIGSVVYAVKPGDGSAREQAASCQRVIGGLANICQEYATKRYRSNVINWGMLPLQMKELPDFNVDDYIYIPNIKSAFDGDMENIKGYVIGDEIKEITLYMTGMSSEEKEIIKAGSLINFNKNRAN